MMPSLDIRKARPSEVALLTAIAHEAKRRWGYPEEWIALWRESLTITLDYLSVHEVFVGEYERDVVGFYALVRNDASWELDHLWVVPAFSSRGFGRALFRHAVERLASASPGTPLEIESDPNAEQFYLHMGAMRTGEVTRDWPGLKRSLPHLTYLPEPS